MALAALICGWVVTSALLWPHRTATTAVATVIGLAGASLAMLAVLWPGWRVGVAVVGAGLAASAFLVPDVSLSTGNRVLSAAALFLLALGRAPKGEEEVVGAEPSSARLAGWLTMSAATRRLLHGMGWGALATVAMGAATLLMMAVRLWPVTRPLSLLVARQIVGSVVSLPVLVVIAALAQLVYGALCGGLLCALSDPVELPAALGLGFIRWLNTQWLVLPALGWAEFGLTRAPALAVATMVPHLVYSLALGALMHREDRGQLRGPHWSRRSATR